MKTMLEVESVHRVSHFCSLFEWRIIFTSQVQLKPLSDVVIVKHNIIVAGYCFDGPCNDGIKLL